MFGKVGKSFKERIGQPLYGIVVKTSEHEVDICCCDIHYEGFLQKSKELKAVEKFTKKLQKELKA